MHTRMLPDPALPMQALLSPLCCRVCPIRRAPVPRGAGTAGRSSGGQTRPWSTLRRPRRRRRWPGCGGGAGPVAVTRQPHWLQGPLARPPRGRPVSCPRSVTCVHDLGFSVTGPGDQQAFRLGRCRMRRASWATRAGSRKRGARGDMVPPAPQNPAPPAHAKRGTSEAKPGDGAGAGACS